MVTITNSMSGINEVFVLNLRDDIEQELRNKGVIVDRGDGSTVIYAATLFNMSQKYLKYGNMLMYRICYNIGIHYGYFNIRKLVQDAFFRNSIEEVRELLNEYRTGIQDDNKLNFIGFLFDILYPTDKQFFPALPKENFHFSEKDGINTVVDECLAGNYSIALSLLKKNDPHRSEPLLRTLISQVVACDIEEKIYSLIVDENYAEAKKFARENLSQGNKRNIGAIIKLLDAIINSQSLSPIIKSDSSSEEISSDINTGDIFDYISREEYELALFLAVSHWGVNSDNIVLILLKKIHDCRVQYKDDETRSLLVEALNCLYNKDHPDYLNYQKAIELFEKYFSLSEERGYNISRVTYARVGLAYFQLSKMATTTNMESDYMDRAIKYFTLANNGNIEEMAFDFSQIISTHGGYQNRPL